MGCGPQLAARHDAALRRWEARPATHYLLLTREEVGGTICGQQVEVRDEQLQRIVSNSCRHPTLWTVTELFRRAERARAPTDRCARHEPGAGCICRDDVVVQVEYDQAMGFPRLIVIRQTWSPAWQEISFWRYTLQRGALASCRPPSTTSEHRIAVRALRPLP